MSGQSSVGNRQVYEANEQVQDQNSKVNDRERFKEGQPNSHLANDSKDERSIANKLEREAKREKEGESESLETRQLKEDPTLPAVSHGNKPSKGAQIDKEIQEEEEEILRKKGAK
ncbi:hypothetical protein M433DRAFT_3556 [Acidomyces richmondensis BFW]|nr:MAG: hypothetical protein FE78DRAFT_152052 [Acidomyces sp. 'richmondensis']KYG46629.1 hypothetical protein M433DRAFT_3556 [Acidomyces richmondensis BFW]